ncbi:MAG: bifunctional folylpolyglutamate synthase/dihydrofolate synthase [Gemmatimonadales bacterium]
MKWGLETTRRLLDVLGNPQRHFASVHIGGTNGKGSTAAFLAAMLRAEGLRVGLYTSPHLVSFTERMQVDGVPVAEAAVASWATRLEETAERLEASFFEITTAIAFADFAARGVEIAVVEVGLGGRLDSTNVIEPLASGVTRIALEHTEYLGHDLAGIAREKAAIAKPTAPFFTTETDPGLLATMREVVLAAGTAFIAVDPASASGRRLGLAGPHQVANASLAMAMAGSLPPPFRPGADAVSGGLLSARIPGRFDRRGPWLFDVAHNPDGIRALTRALDDEHVPRPLVAVVSVLRDKAWEEMLAELGRAADALILTRAPSSPAERAWDLDEVAAWCQGEGLTASIEPGFERALESARGRGGTALVTGSFHTVGDAMARLPGFSPLG